MKRSTSSSVIAAAPPICSAPGSAAMSSVVIPKP